ncbi:polysaccharide biosynthesis C-terminal domain-containing protein [Bacillus sp. ISL-18]|uniref:murein biosynthesis integral membrane protein MurJ n=1 Tax=Bacillus sp. ISL-18 TaxID=2819118 RepID=UPI001BEAC201|nr:lipid II flippase MurJ [Bacillus sp. ISL-18]MBT2658623.1 polysaccharide biosynthesis C-terminal domain-containing protein [Bacillus sp. ISL-18]
MKFIRYFSGVALLTLITQVLMMARSMFMANHFGVSVEMDAYNLANVLTVSITGIVSAAITTVLIPSLSNQKYSLEEREGINTYVTVLTFLSIGFVGLFVIFGSPLVKLFSLNYKSNEQSLIFLLTVILAVSQIFKVISGISTAYLQTNSDFFTPKLAGLLASVVSISYFLFSSHPNIYGVTIVLGISFMFEFLVMVVKQRGLRTNITINFKTQNPIYKMLLRNTAPIILSSAAFQVSLVFSNFIASYFGKGYVSIFGYGNQIVNIFHGLIVLNIITMLYPNLARKFEESIESAKDSLVNYINLTNMMIIPIVFGFIAVGDLIIEIIFQRGNFTAHNTHQVYLISSIIFISFPINTARDFVYRSFYCINDTKTPSRNSIYVVAINIVLILALIPILKVYSIAVGPVLASVISLVMSYNKLRKKIGVVDQYNNLLKNNFTFTIIGLIMCLVLLFIKPNLGHLVPYVELFLLILIGGIIYILLLVITKKDFVLNSLQNIRK